MYLKKIPKGRLGSGKFRRVLVPTGELRELQDAALQYLTSKDDTTGRYAFTLFDCHTAFKRGSSAYSNAQAHVGYGVSVKFDIRKFFDSVPATERKARRVMAYFKKRLQVFLHKLRNGRRVPLSGSHRMRVPSVLSTLIAEGIPADIATLIADISSYRGYLYQGSPLAPMLANLVTKHSLAPRLLKLATNYDLPIFCLHGTKFIVVSMDGKTVWHHGFQAGGVDLEFIQKMVWEGQPYGRPPVPWSPDTEFKVMTRDKSESRDKMLLRYGNQAWIPRRGGTVTNLRRYFIRRQRTVGTPPEAIHLSWADFRTWDRAKTVFTIYADDGMFSSNNTKLFHIKYVLRRVIEFCGFRVNSQKGIRVMRSSRYVTGYEVSEAPPGTKDEGARLSWKYRDMNYRRPLHHMRTGKIPVDEETIMRFNGKLAYIKQSNPNSWLRYAREFYEIVMEAGLVSDPDVGQILADMVERYEHL